MNTTLNVVFLLSCIYLVNRVCAKSSVCFGVDCSIKDQLNYKICCSNVPEEFAKEDESFKHLSRSRRESRWGHHTSEEGTCSCKHCTDNDDCDSDECCQYNNGCLDDGDRCKKKFHCYCEKKQPICHDINCNGIDDPEYVKLIGKEIIIICCSYGCKENDDCKKGECCARDDVCIGDDDRCQDKDLCYCKEEQVNKGCLKNKDCPNDECCKKDFKCIGTHEKCTIFDQCKCGDPGKEGCNSNDDCNGNECCADENGDCLEDSESCSHHESCNCQKSETPECRVNDDCMKNECCAEYGQCLGKGKKCKSTDNCKCQEILPPGGCKSDDDCLFGDCCTRKGKCIGKREVVLMMKSVCACQNQLVQSVW